MIHVSQRWEIFLLKISKYWNFCWSTRRGVSPKNCYFKSLISPIQRFFYFLLWLDRTHNDQTSLSSLKETVTQKLLHSYFCLRNPRIYVLGHCAIFALKSLGNSCSCWRSSSLGHTTIGTRSSSALTHREETAIGFQFWQGNNEGTTEDDHSLLVSLTSCLPHAEHLYRSDFSGHLLQSSAIYRVSQRRANVEWQRVAKCKMK